MLCGFDDGTEVMAEPLLEKDVVIDVDEKSAIINVKFSTLPPQEDSVSASTDINEFSDEFSELKRTLTASADSMKDVIPTDNSVAFNVAGSWTALPMASDSLLDSRSRKPRLKKKKNARTNSARAKKGSNEYIFQQFVKASRYARGAGASAIHPSAKLQLFALLMQAQKGDCPSPEKRSDRLESVTGTSVVNSATSLEKLKLKAWDAMRGIDQIEAMKKYLKLLTSLAYVLLQLKRTSKLETHRTRQTAVEGCKAPSRSE